MDQILFSVVRYIKWDWDPPIPRELQLEEPSGSPRNRFIIDPSFLIRRGGITLADYADAGRGTHDGDNRREDNQISAIVAAADALEGGYP